MKRANLGKRIKTRIRENLKSYHFKLPIPLPTRLPWGGWWLSWNDGIGRFVFWREAFELGETNWLMNFLTPGMTVFDVGAHQGYYTLLASKKVGKTGKVFSFEPSIRESRRLKLNLRLNRLGSNVVLEPTALSNREGESDFFVCLGPDTGCNSLQSPDVQGSIKKMKVPLTTLDAYITKHNIKRIDFMKVDVEGGERDLFSGASIALKNLRPIILCEVDDLRTRAWGYASNEIYDLFGLLGYHRFFITPEGKLKPAERREEFLENLIAVPEEKIEQVVPHLTPEAVMGIAGRSTGRIRVHS